MSEGFIIGEKIALRAIRRSDMGAYARWLDNHDVTHFLEMGWKPLSEPDLEATFKSLTESAETVAFVIEDRASGEAVGTCGLYLIQWVARRAQFNILIGEPSVWDKGFGTEATRLVVGYGFDTLNLESIQLGVNADNDRALKSYEKTGFVHEGRRRKFVYRNGRYYDLVVMGIVREEYQAAKSDD